MLSENTFFFSGPLPRRGGHGIVSSTGARADRSQSGGERRSAKNTHKLGRFSSSQQARNHSASRVLGFSPAAALAATLSLKIRDDFNLAH